MHAKQRDSKCLFAQFALSLFLVLHFLTQSEGNVVPDSGETRTRVARSPGLFGGGLAENLKPVTFADLNALRDQIKNFDVFSARIDEVIAAEKQARNGLQKLIETTKEQISNLENAVNPDDSNFFGDSQTCGGIIVSQTGRISYKPDLTYENYEKCVWTVRANYRSKVKVQLVAEGFENNGFDQITVSEVNADSTGLKSVKLIRNQIYLFNGPVLIISFVSDGTGTGEGFTLNFEGLGRNLNKNTLYKHFHLDDFAGSFSSQNLTSTADKDSRFPSIPSLPSTSTSKRLFSTVVINPQYKNATQLSLNVPEGSVQLNPEDCGKSALYFYDDILESKSSGNRCCGKKCDKSKYANSDGVFLITLSSDLKASNNFKFNWEIDTDDLSSVSVDTCGGVLSGRAGRISYKLNEAYNSNERCVWVIKPTGKSKVKLTLIREEIEDGYDFLTATEIEDTFAANSNVEPKITHLKSSTVYNFTGPLVFITFSSDGSAEGQGFELVWVDVGSNLNENSPKTDPIYVDQESGTQVVTLESAISQIVVINPKYLDGSSLNLKLNRITPDLGKNCGVNGVTVYGSGSSNYSVARRYCEDTGDNFHPEEFQASGGIFILAYRTEASVGFSLLDSSWMKGPPPSGVALDGDQVTVQTEGCGGILIGDSGRIDYMLNVSYVNNERCTWIVQSARRSKLTLKLLEDGFESCCDFLIVAPLVPENGTVGKNPVKINRENKLQSFNGPVVVTFYSDTSIGESGFSLEFTTGGPIQENPVKYTHNILKETTGSISYPSENQVLPSKNEIVTFVFTPESLITSTILQTNVTLEVEGLGVDKECHKDSLSFTETPIKEESIWKSLTCGGENEPASCGCSADKAKSSEELVFNNRGFIVVIKSVESNEGKSYRFNWTSTNDPPAEEETSSAPEETSTVAEVTESTTTT